MSAPLRLLLVTQYFHPETFPINSLVPALVAAGAHVTVLTGQPNYPDGRVFPGYRAMSTRRERLHDTVDVIRVPIVPRGRNSALRLAANYLSFIASAWLVGSRMLRGLAVDVVFVYAPSPILQAIPAILIARRKRARVVTWVQDLWPQSLESTGFVTNPALLRVAASFVRRIYEAHDLLLGQSQRFVSAIRPLAGRVPVEYLPNPSQDVFSTGAVGALELPDAFNVVFAGNMGTVQALDTVLDAAALLRDEGGIHIVLVGSGSRSAWLADEVRSRGLRNVLLPGRFDAAEMPGIYSQADLLLVTLKRAPILSQTIPSKVQSYLSAGRPIVAALDGEGADLVRDAGAGLVGPAEDAEALAANIRALFRASREERERFGAAGRAYYERHFHPDVLAAQLLTRLAELAAAPHLPERSTVSLP